MTWYGGIMANRFMADGIGGRATDPQRIREAWGIGVLVAGYITGEWAWTPQQWDLFRPEDRVTVVTVDVDEGDIADVENGDLTPAQAGDWIKRRRASGYNRPTVYCSRGTIPVVRAATGTLVLNRDY